MWGRKRVALAIGITIVVIVMVGIFLWVVFTGYTMDYWPLLGMFYYPSRKDSSL